jgi:hypothetical protein
MPPRPHRSDGSLKRTSASSRKIVKRPLQLLRLPQYVPQEVSRLHLALIFVLAFDCVAAAALFPRAPLTFLPPPMLR